MGQLKHKVANVTALICCLIASACSKPQSPPTITEVDTPNAGNMADENMASANFPTIPPPTPHYQDREGDRYFYVSAVSEEDQKRGKAVGDVLEYRFVGEMYGKLVLQQLSENGDIISRLECPRDCRIMKLYTTGNVSRLPFDSSSIGGAAMEDAINGFLVPHRGRSTRRLPSTLNEDVSPSVAENAT